MPRPKKASGSDGIKLTGSGSRYQSRNRASGDRVSAIRDKYPNGDAELITNVIGDTEIQQKLVNLAKSEGGLVLIESSAQDIVSSIDNLIGMYHKASHSELVAMIARLEARLGILRVLSKSEKNLELAENYLKELTT